MDLSVRQKINQLNDESLQYLTDISNHLQENYQTFA
jgi:hypothetical protein